MNAVRKITTRGYPITTRVKITLARQVLPTSMKSVDKITAVGYPITASGYIIGNTEYGMSRSEMDMSTKTARRPKRR
jgi:hypothetical protein